MAVGDSILSFAPLSNSPPSSAFATLSIRNGFVVLDMDDTTNEQAIFHAVLPSHYSGGQVEVRVIWTSTTAISGNAKFRIEVTGIQAGDNLDVLPAVDGSSEVVATAPLASGNLVVSQTTAMDAGAVNSGDLLLISITRLATDAADTITGDIELLAVEVREV